LLPGAGLQDLDDLVALVLDPLLGIPETADESTYPGEYDEPVRLWLQGMTVSAVASTLGVSTETMSELIEEFVAYKLPWGVTALWRIATLELELEGMSDVTEALPAMLKYGVPTPEATWAHAAGVSSRNFATSLGERFAAEAETSTANAFSAWLAMQQVETLVAGDAPGEQRLPGRIPGLQLHQRVQQDVGLQRRGTPHFKQIAVPGQREV
jgi:hypothetical protein